MIEKIMTKLLNRETISYLFFGVLATVVSIGSYYISSRILINFIGYDETVMCSNVVSWYVQLLLPMLLIKYGCSSQKLKN